MSLIRRIDRFVRPPGYVPLGSPRTQAHYARWWRWYGLAGTLGLVLVTFFSLFREVDWVNGLGGFSLLLILYALWGWRITHPPQEDRPD